MLEAHLDESGVHSNAAICVIAGYFAGTAQWKKFELLWRKTLTLANVPLEEFHASALVNRHGFFSRDKWDDERHRSFIRSITGAIMEYKISPVAVGLVVADFNACSLAQRQFFTGATIENGKIIGISSPNKPYFMPFQTCVRRLGEYAPVGGKIHFFFGLDRPFSRYATELYERVKSNPRDPERDRYGQISFPLAKETPQLQAADFLVHLTYQHMRERSKANDWEVYPSFPLGQLIRKARAGRGDFIFYEKETIAGNLAEAYRREGTDWDGHATGGQQ